MLLEAKLFFFNHHSKFLHNSQYSALNHRMLLHELKNHQNDSPLNPKVCPSYLQTKGRVANWISLEQLPEPKYCFCFLEPRFYVFYGWHPLWFSWATMQDSDDHSSPFLWCPSRPCFFGWGSRRLHSVVSLQLQPTIWIEEWQRWRWRPCLGTQHCSH